MSETLINLIIQLVAGALGGNGAGNALKDLYLGPLGNTIAGAIGGVAGVKRSFGTHSGTGGCCWYD